MGAAVCPLISTGGQIFQCHPLCNFRDENGNCKFLKFMDNIEKLVDKSTNS